MPHQMGIAESCGMWVPVVRLQRCCLDLCLSDIAAQKTSQSEGVASLYEPKHLLNLVDVFQVRPESQSTWMSSRVNVFAFCRQSCCLM